MSGVDRSVSVQLSEVLNLRQSLLILAEVRVSFKVRVSKTIFDGVSQLLATHTSDVLSNFSIFVPRFRFIVAEVIIFFAFMLAELTPWLLFLTLTAAPPHLPTPVGLMRAARPVKIFFFIVLLSALLAGFI